MLLFLRVLIILGLLLPVAVKADANELMIGVSFNLRENGMVILSSMRPYVNGQINESYPNGINKFRVKEVHHGYAGLALFGSGLLLKNRTLRVLGEVLFIDDAIQHALRVKTPLHMISDELWRYSWYRRCLTL
jgi:hypothetical protein